MTQFPGQLCSDVLLPLPDKRGVMLCVMHVDSNKCHDVACHVWTHMRQDSLGEICINAEASRLHISNIHPVSWHTVLYAHANAHTRLSLLLHRGCTQYHLSSCFPVPYVTFPVGMHTPQNNIGCRATLICMLSLSCHSLRVIPCICHCLCSLLGGKLRFMPVRFINYLYQVLDQLHIDQ